MSEPIGRRTVAKSGRGLRKIGARGIEGVWPASGPVLAEPMSAMPPVGPEHLGRLYDAQGPALRLYARQWCDAQGAEDLVHEAFVTLARQAVAPEAPGPWLYRTVRNAALAAHRTDRRRHDRERRAAGPEAAFGATDDQIDAATATALLAELESELREVVVARIWGGLTFDEIARLQACSLATAHRRYHAGLARLQERLDGPCPTTPTTPATTTTTTPAPPARPSP